MNKKQGRLPKSEIVNPIMMKEAKNLLLINMPKNVNNIIREEQRRISFEEKVDFKKFFVVYKIIIEWNQFNKQIQELKNKIE